MNRTNWPGSVQFERIACIRYGTHRLWEPPQLKPILNSFRLSTKARHDPYHNAQAESFMKTSKVEDVYMAGYDSFPDVAERLPRYIEEVYNSKRLQSALSYRTPEEFEIQLARKAA